MIEIAFAIPGDLAAPTGGYAYARQLLAHLPKAGVTARYVALPGSFPRPTAEDLAETAATLAALPPNLAILVDGLALGAIPTDLLAPFAGRLAALVHHPLGYETGLDAAEREAFLASECAALAMCRHVIVSSPTTAGVLATELGVPREAITVAEPGTERAARAALAGDQPLILAVGTVSPRKGYDLLIKALSTLADLPWRAVIAGSLDHDPATVAALRQAIEDSGLGDRITFAGAVSDDALAALYAGADLFVAPTRYEGYGMAITEALARGLPIVAATGGAVAETLPDGAGRKVPPEDAAALAMAMMPLVASRIERERLADTAWAVGSRLPRWPDAALRVADVFLRLVDAGTPR